MKEREHDKRSDFLLHMYDQTFNNVNRHVIIGWQSASVVLASLAALSLVEKGITPAWAAISVLLVFTSWYILQIIDSSAWVNRNMYIIANIEREFLSSDDKERIHYYWTKHRKPRMMGHFSLQIGLGIGLGLVILIWHFVKYVLFRDVAKLGERSCLDGLPYLIFLGQIAAAVMLNTHYSNRHKKLRNSSPGKPIDTKTTDSVSGDKQ